MDRLNELSHGAKVVLGCAIALLIVSFFNWYTLGPFGENMWHGIGVIAGLLVIALIAWQAVRLANINVEIGVTPAMITAFLAVLTFVFVLIRFLDKPYTSAVDRSIWAWIGLILAIVIVAGAWWNMQLAGESLGDVKGKLSSMGSGGGGGGEGPSSSSAPPPPSTSAPADTPETPPSSDPAEGP